MNTPPHFDGEFRQKLHELFLWRRDVRAFRSDPLPPALLNDLFNAASLAPSVGLSEPWRFVLVDDPARRMGVKDSFLAANADALVGYEGERAQLYSTLKLEGLHTAPVHLAVFCDESTSQGHGLGRRTMPETLSYSVVASIQTLWLAARANGIGLGWVSILDAADIKKVLDVPEPWNFIAYLCMGLPKDNSCEPKLAEVAWEQRQNIHEFILQR